MAYRHYVQKQIKQRKRAMARAQRAANRELKRKMKSAQPSEPQITTTVESAPGSRSTFNCRRNLRLARLGRFHFPFQLAIGRPLRPCHCTFALLDLLLDIMAIGHFAAPARRGVSATAKAKRNEENQENGKSSLVHTSLGAQAVRGPSRTGIWRERLEQFAHAVHRVEINAVRTAAQKFLCHQIDRVVALRRHGLRQRGFILAAAGNLEKIPALRWCDPELNAARVYRDLADWVAFTLTQLDVDLAIIRIHQPAAPVACRLVDLPV